MAPLHVGQEIRPASDQHRPRAFGGEDLRRLTDGSRRMKPEPGQPHHASASFLAGLRRRLLTGFPSPPSQGGGTSIGSGYGTSGKLSGPARGGSPLAFFLLCANNLAG